MSIFIHFCVTFIERRKINRKFKFKSQWKSTCWRINNEKPRVYTRDLVNFNENAPAFPRDYSKTRKCAIFSGRPQRNKLVHLAACFSAITHRSYRNDLSATLAQLGDISHLQPAMIYGGARPLLPRSSFLFFVWFFRFLCDPVSKMTII